jgi:hypothetical protein
MRVFVDSLFGHFEEKHKDFCDARRCALIEDGFSFWCNQSWSAIENGRRKEMLVTKMRHPSTSESVATHIDVDLHSRAIARLIEEVRGTDFEVTRAYNRTYNRHNR